MKKYSMLKYVVGSMAIYVFMGLNLSFIQKEPPGGSFRAFIIYFKSIVSII
jgi:hypothetical protein